MKYISMADYDRFPASLKNDKTSICLSGPQADLDDP